MKFSLHRAGGGGFLVTQVVLVSSRATECFHGLELPTHGEGFGVDWRAILWEGRCSAPTPSCLCGLLSWPEHCPGVEQKRKTPASTLGRSRAPRQSSWKHSLWKPPEENPRMRHGEVPLSIPLPPSRSCLSKSRAAAAAVLPITLVTLAQGAKLSQGRSCASPCHSSGDTQLFPAHEQPNASWEEPGACILLQPALILGGSQWVWGRERSRGEMWRWSRAAGCCPHAAFVWVFSLPRTHSCYSSLAAGLAQSPSLCV